MRDSEGMYPDRPPLLREEVSLRAKPELEVPAMAINKGMTLMFITASFIKGTRAN